MYDLPGFRASSVRCVDIFGSITTVLGAAPIKDAQSVVLLNANFQMVRDTSIISLPANPIGEWSVTGTTGSSPLPTSVPWMLNCPHATGISVPGKHAPIRPTLLAGARAHHLQDFALGTRP